MSFAALHALLPVLAELLRPVGSSNLAPAGKRHDDGRHVVLAAHLFCESENAVGGDLGRHRSSCEVRDLFV